MEQIILEALARALAVGTPLLLACLGAILNERGGVVNLGVEGLMAVGALAAFAVAYPQGNLWLAVGAAMLAGAALAALHALATVTLRANQFVSGLALALLGTGAAGLLGKKFEGMPLFNKVPDWTLGGFALSPFTVAALVLAALLAFWLGSTRGGLTLRSVGENPAAADALGVSVVGVRYAAVLAGGALAGLAGAFLALSYRASWADNPTAGLGWIAVALVIFVGWQPLRAVAGALFFGFLYYLQFRLQGSSAVPTEVFSAMPFVLVLVVLALAGLRGQQGNAPASLGRTYVRGER
ncbi:ABC transporter permease [Deinococcus hopiensis]|uniref:Nucleoside ABC transporter membrane protein n=1 Tax=Deinococcus hopiensis KR-140 TaxID=695939 RepID=A0A1W1VMB2_9DEIO|nr:ABC transporter permease [Deinococcus hopiensis]SMB94525.1 nucleoside ABC transporter membrane protein [Deinococcus hopiensis KR-140]